MLLPITRLTLIINSYNYSLTEVAVNSIHFMHGPEGNSFVFPRVLMDHTLSALLYTYTFLPFINMLSDLFRVMLCNLAYIVFACISSAQIITMTNFALYFAQRPYNT